MVILNDSNAPSRLYYVPDIVFELSKTPKITFLLIGGPKISHNTYPHSLTHTCTTRNAPALAAVMARARLTADPQHTTLHMAAHRHSNRQWGSPEAP